MFAISAQSLGKKFYGRWLFKDLEFSLVSGERLALVGTNGAGKSTLVRMIAGQLSPTQGKMLYAHNQVPVSHDALYRYLSWAGPQLDLYAELTLREHLKLHFTLKKCLLPNIEAVIDILQLGQHADKPLQYYSSGMLQRARVGIVLFTQSELLLLDEPTSNMDEGNAARMLALIEAHRGDRVYVLATNLSREYERFERVITLG